MEVLKSDAKSVMAKFLYVKKFITKQESLLGEAKAKAEKKAEFDAKKVPERVAKETPFNISNRASRWRHEAVGGEVLHDGSGPPRDGGEDYECDEDPR